jgi:hypothetical protein
MPGEATGHGRKLSLFSTATWAVEGPSQIFKNHIIYLFFEIVSGFCRMFNRQQVIGERPFDIPVGL